MIWCDVWQFSEQRWTKFCELFVDRGWRGLTGYPSDV